MEQIPHGTDSNWIMACTEVVVHRAGRNLGLYLTAAATFAGCAHLGPNTVAVDRFDYTTAIAESWK